MAEKRKSIKVLIIEDSVSVQKLLSHIISSDPEMIITGIASDGYEGLEMIQKERPDVITMDMDMPRMDGETTTRKIMEEDPIPIIVITASLSARDVRKSYRAIDAGALSVIQKPPGLGHRDYEQIAAALLKMIRAYASVTLVTRRTGRTHVSDPDLNPGQEQQRIFKDGEIRFVALGASTGGPPVIKEILTGIPKSFDFSVIVVQHIAEGFIEGFADWLGKATGHEITISSHGAKIEAGRIYVASAGADTIITGNRRFVVEKSDNYSPVSPSVDKLFYSLADHFGKQSLGVLLTGMGKDGAKGLLSLKEAGALTVTQDEETSTIYGMPGEGQRIGASKYSLSVSEITQMISGVINRQVSSDK